MRRGRCTHARTRASIKRHDVASTRVLRLPSYNVDENEEVVSGEGVGKERGEEKVEEEKKEEDESWYRRFPRNKFTSKDSLSTSRDVREYLANSIIPRDRTVLFSFFSSFSSSSTTGPQHLEEHKSYRVFPYRQPPTRRS